MKWEDFQKLQAAQALPSVQVASEPKENATMGWLNIVLALLKLVPSILAMITQVESVFGAGNGAAKKAVVMSAVTGSTTPLAVTEGVSTFVDHAVTALNTAGKFGTKGAAATSPILPQPAAVA